MRNENGSFFSYPSPKMPRLFYFPRLCGLTNMNHLRSVRMFAVCGHEDEEHRDRMNIIYSFRLLWSWCFVRFEFWAENTQQLLSPGTSYCSVALLWLLFALMASISILQLLYSTPLFSSIPPPQVLRKDPESRNRPAWLNTPQVLASDRVQHPLSP